VFAWHYHQLADKKDDSHAEKDNGDVEAEKTESRTARQSQIIHYQKKTHRRMIFARLLYPVYTLIGGTFFLWLFTNPTAATMIEVVRSAIIK